MIREIKYKGLRVDGKGWVCGYLVVDPQDRYRIYYQPFKASISNTYQFVISETVCQFTGLKDKNGLEIYEDDIVVDIKEPNLRFAVILDWYWTDNDGRGEDNVYGWQLMPLDGGTYSIPLDTIEYEYKVIGNIHEKGGSNG